MKSLDNEKYGCPYGELLIVRQVLPADERANVVGRIIPWDIGLLSYIIACRCRIQSTEIQ